MWSELPISSSPFFKCPRVHPCECGCIHEDTLFPILPGAGFDSSTDGWALIVDAWLYFLGVKVGIIFSILSFLAIGLDYESLDSMEYDYSWARRLTGMFSLIAVFVFLSTFSLLICRMTADQACFFVFVFVTHSFVCGCNNRIPKYFHLENCMTNRPPHRHLFVLTCY